MRMAFIRRSDVMTTRLRCAILGSVLLGTATSAVAADPLGLDVEGTPLNPRLELVQHLTDRLNLRFGVSPGIGTDRPLQGQPLLSDPLNTEFSAAALVDWSFSSWGLRLTGGALYANGESGGTHGAGYTSSWQLDTDTHAVSPYFGLGLSNDFGSQGRFGLQLDLGLAFEAVPEAEGRAEVGSPLESQDPGLDGKLGSMFEGMRYSPVLSAGFRYRF